MIDVHVLIRENPDQDYLKQCLASVSNDKLAILHPLPGISGHIGAGRLLGYARGEQDWVAYVDDDDWVLPDTFSQCVSYLSDASISSIQIGVQWRNADGTRKNMGYKSGPASQEPEYLPRYKIVNVEIFPNMPFSDHLILYRRSLLVKLLPIYAEYPRGGDVAVAKAFHSMYAGTRRIIIRNPYYMWRAK